jgi:hypothetical protein
MKWARCVHTWENRNASKIMARKPEGKRPLGIPRRRCEDNIKLDIKEEGSEDVDCYRLSGRWRKIMA